MKSLTWKQYLKKNRSLGSENMYRTLNRIGTWKWKANRGPGQDGWTNTWGDVVQIASQILKEDQ